MINNSATLSEWKEAYQQAASGWNQWLIEAYRDIQFYLGDQWNSQEKTYLKNQRRQILAFNKIRRVVHLVDGFERKNRLSIKVDPIEGSDVQAAGQISGLLQYLFQYGGCYEAMSDAFLHGPLKTGINLLEVMVDYSEDPIDGDIGYARLPYNEFLLDPNFSDPSLKNCRYILRRKWVSKDEAKSILPGNDKEIDDITPKGMDDKFTFAMPAKNLDGTDLGRLDHFFVRQKEKRYWIVNELTGQSMNWQESKSKLDAMLRSPSSMMGMNYGQFVRVIPYYANTVRQVILYEEHVFYDDKDVLGIDDYPFVAEIGFWDPEYDSMDWKLQGLVRCMRDPQTEVNRRRSKMVDIIDSVLSTGWKGKAGAVVDPESLYYTGQGKVIWMNKNSQMTDVEQLQPAQIPAGLFQSIELFDKDIIDIPGANSELMGSPEKEDIQISGILSKLRQGAGLTILQGLFDNHRNAKKQIAQKTIQAIRANYSPQKIKVILNEDPNPEIFKPETGKYNCVPVEGVLTDTQRQMYFAQLMAFKQMGAPIPWAELLEASPIEYKEKLMKAVAMADQAQMQAAQVQAQSQQATDRLMQAEAQARIAKAQLDTVKQQETLAAAGLDRAKTISEIQGMTFDRLLNLVQMALALEQGAQQQPGNVIPMRQHGITRR